MATGVQSVQRAFDILEELSRQGRSVGVRELARTLGLKVPTLHNLVKTLAMRGYVAKDEASGRYRLGPRCFELAGSFLRGMHLPELADPFMNDLAKEIGEAVTLAAIDAGEVVWAAHARGTRTIIVNMAHREARDAYNAASGLTLLAHAPQDVLKEYVRAHPLRESCNEQIRTLRDLRTELARIRQRGYAVIERKGADTISAVGAPIRDAAGAVRAALGISMPSARFRGAHRQAVIRGILAAADQISAMLGYIATESRTSATETREDS